MNTIKINVVRILAIIGTIVCLKLAFQEEPFMDTSILVAKLIFGIIPVWIIAYFWSKAETSHSEYQREIKKEQNGLRGSENNKENVKYIYVERNKFGISQLIIILAAIATILATLKEFIK